MLAMNFTNEKAAVIIKLTKLGTVKKSEKPKIWNGKEHLYGK